MLAWFFGTLSRRGFIIRSIIFFIIFYLWWEVFSKDDNGLSVLFIILLFLGVIVSLIYASSLLIRRLHDIGLSGWLSLIFIPFPYLWFILFLIPSKKGPNKHKRAGPPITRTNLLIEGVLILFLTIVAIIAFFVYAMATWQF